MFYYFSFSHNSDSSIGTNNFNCHTAMRIADIGSVENSEEKEIKDL